LEYVAQELEVNNWS